MNHSAFSVQLSAFGIQHSALTVLERTRPLVTPNTGDRVVKDWMIINLVQITGIEPVESLNGKVKKKVQKDGRRGETGIPGRIRHVRITGRKPVAHVKP